MTFDDNQTIGAFIDHLAGDVEALTLELESLARDLAGSPGRVDLQRRYDRTLASIELASQGAGRAAEILAALGLGDLPRDTPTSHLSGGSRQSLRSSAGDGHGS